MRYDPCLCGNCDRWREEHYDGQGAWIQDQGCDEYQGVMPSAARMKQRDKELQKSREEADAMLSEPQ